MGSGFYSGYVAVQNRVGTVHDQHLHKLEDDGTGTADEDSGKQTVQNVVFVQLLDGIPIRDQDEQDQAEDGPKAEPDHEHPHQDDENEENKHVHVKIVVSEDV